MFERRVKSLAALGIVVATVLPVGLSIYLARQQGLDEERQRVLGYARQVLTRSEETTDQIYTDFQILAASPDPNPCSPANIELMRRLDLESEMIQAIGVVNGDRLLCSSLTSPDQPIELGPPDSSQPAAARLWFSAEIPFAKGYRFLIVARGRYAAIVHRAVPLAVGNVDPRLQVALVARDPKSAILVSPGHVNPAWLNALHNKSQVSFTDDNDVVAVVASRRYGFDAIADLPMGEVNRRTRDIARWLVPFGILMGVLLSWATVALARAQLAMPAMLKAALKRDELFLVYQPVVDLRTGRWVGAEALIRWQRPKGETVRPDVFIVAAEDNGMIRQVTEKVVLDQVRKHADALFSQYPDFHIAINLAAEDLQSPATVRMLDELLRTTGARSRNLIVEATERSFAAPNSVRDIIGALHALGIRVAIDDFGTGYSSLSFLASLDFDLLKIDKSFVDTVETGAATSQVIHHIIEMAKSLGLEMIAEGVETETQARFLRERGVQYAQGWLFAKAMTFDQLLDALNREREAENATSSATLG